MTAEEWLQQFSAALGADPPDEGTTAQLLDLAATAAHASERIAAPIACYLAGRDGRSLDELRELADGIGAQD
jgi:hypothetical protein